MSLDCYPLSGKRTIELREQPIALEVAYDENLLITVVDNCRWIVVFDLEQLAAGRERSEPSQVGRFQLDDKTVIDQVIYCKQGDYIACKGHSNGQVNLYVVTNWRHRHPGDRDSCQVEQLDLREAARPFDELDRCDKLNNIGACQRTGNLVASYGDLIVIYQLISRRDQRSMVDSTSSDSMEDMDKLTLDEAIKQQRLQNRAFRHLISVKLSLWASCVSLAENYLSIMAMDHVQVLKLELLTLQIQSDGVDGDGSLLCQQQQVCRSAGSSGESQAGLMAGDGRQRGASVAAGQGATSSKSGGVGQSTIEGGGSGSASGDDDETIGSIVSGMTSNQSTRTNFSSFLATDNDDELAQTSSTATSNTTAAAAARPDGSEADEQLPQQLANVDSDMSIITMNDTLRGLAADQQQAQQDQEMAKNQAVVSSQDDCITWNLNTKKLVKLPTLMHNTSRDLSSFHICHPLELLGPASESIACRVSARIYSPELGQNQLEPVVLLCKQFDFDRDPVKLVHLQTVYLANQEDLRRLGRAAATAAATSETQPNLMLDQTTGGDPQADQLQRQLLKSADHELLTSVCCFVATLTNCFVYSLQGKKVVRLQTITHPGLCLDLRVDLLNVLLLTPLGLQICSTNVCDATFRYDWSSSADLNLNFVACDRARVLTTSRHVVMVSAAPPQQGDAGATRGAQQMSCFVEVLKKPSFRELHQRIEHTTQRCQSISIRSNLLTYLHATAQLSVIELERRRAYAIDRPQLGEAQTLAQEVAAAAPQSSAQFRPELEFELEIQEAVENLKRTALLLARQLLQKKQTNVITNGRIDKTIKHLLDNSYCDLAELMQRHLSSAPNKLEDPDRELAESLRSRDGDNDGDKGSGRALEHEQLDEEEEAAIDCDFELLRIFLRHTKFNQTILDYLKSLSDERTSEEGLQLLPFERLAGYMFDYNPRLLIKCAQRIKYDDVSAPLDGRLVQCLVDKLGRLAEFNSTGINRATVLFTLAVLHHASRRADDTDDQAARHGQCLAALGRIKPLNHLAITMCSNHEIISPSIARLVHANHPQVFRLFLNQLQKRGNQLAARQFELLVAQSSDIDETLLAATPCTSASCSSSFAASNTKRQTKATGRDQVEQEDDCTAVGEGKKKRRRSKSVDSKGLDQDEEEEEGDQFEQKLRLLAEVSPLELAGFFCRELELEHESTTQTDDDEQAMRAYLKASINLMESKFILARLSENSR